MKFNFKRNKSRHRWLCSHSDSHPEILASANESLAKAKPTHADRLYVTKCAMTCN